MGNPRKPTVIKKAQGTLRPCRENKNEIQPTIVIDATPPADLNEWGTEYWNTVVSEYRRLGVLSSLDLAALAAVCVEWGVYCEAMDMVNLHGLQVAEEIYSPSGKLVGSRQAVNPMRKVASDAFKNYRMLCVEFGLTPASRSKVTAPEKKEEINPLAQLLESVNK